MNQKAQCAIELYFLPLPTSRWHDKPSLMAKEWTIKSAERRHLQLLKKMRATEPQGMLRWILAIAQTPPSARPNEAELIEYIGVVAHYNSEAGTLYTEDEANRPRVTGPAKYEVSLIIDRWSQILREAVNRELVSVGELKSAPVLTWSAKRGSFKEWEMTDDFVTLAVTTLKTLILEFGSLLKGCDALKPRSNEKCGCWFLALRASQLYCSPTCASRASTQALRPKVKRA